MPEPSKAIGEHAPGGRRLTSHERTAGQPWDDAYNAGRPPWDIGRPQGAIVRLAAKGVFAGPVLDAGCGTGENTLLVASLGLRVLGVDVAETALQTARNKASERGIEAEFAIADALHLERLGRKFESVLDCGLFHTFENDEQLEYAASLAKVTMQDGTLYVLCFSDQEPDVGPHPVRQDELRAALSEGNGWSVVSIEPERIETNFHANGVSAWLATIRRI